MSFQKSHAPKIIALVLVLASIAFRAAALPATNYDLITFNLQWYATLYKQGIAHALSTGFANYTPPYTYFLALATLTHNFISPLVAIKLIPTSFDLLGAFLIYKIVRLKYPQGNLPMLAAAIYFAAPTVMINSSYWGQADSLYTTCLLACLYLLLIEKSFPAMLAFGMAFAFKAQAVFFVPFLFILTLRKKIHWLYFALTPLVYFIAVLPVILLGRPLLDTLLIYTKQSNTFDSLTMNAPNLYYLLPREWLAVIFPLGILITLLAILYWTNATARSSITLDPQNMLFLAFISVALTPYLLPKMHDRYFYPADVLSIALAFYLPGLWFLPILYQIISLTAISGFLFNISPLAIGIAVLVNSLTLAFVLKKQIRDTDFMNVHREVSKKSTGRFSTLTSALLTPTMMVGLILSFLLTPYFLRVAYFTQTDATRLSKSERFHWAAETISYLGNDKKSAYLENLKFKNGKPIFNEHEIALIDSAKQITQTIFNFARVALLGLFVLALLAWIGDTQISVLHGIKWGGWLALGVGILLGLMGVFVGGLSASLGDVDALAQLNPSGVLQSALWAASLSMMVGGFALTKISK